MRPYHANVVADRSDLDETPMPMLRTLASAAPTDRDALVRSLLGLANARSEPPGHELVGYHASAVAAVARVLLEVPVTVGDTFVDLGSGLGSVVILAHLLSGAAARGIEIQSDLVALSRAAAARIGARCDFVLGDARTVPDDALDDGTVFYLYLPFTGSALHDVLARLRRVAARRVIVVATLGVDLERQTDWLVRRELDAFWLAIYDSAIPGAAPRTAAATSADWLALVGAIAFEQPAQ